MNLSHAYGVPPERSAAITLLNEALDLGYDHFDTAALYGFGANETLIGEAVGHRRADYLLASKCVLGRGPDGKRVIDGRPETIKATCEAALQRLRTEVIDLYYLHRLDRTVPIEESVGALVDLIAAGKIRAIGLSEMGAETLRKAHAVHPIAALQTEYSLWSREAEIAVLQACQDLGIAFVAFSPVARGFLTGTLRDLSGLPDNDIRRGMPRFQPEAYGQNLALLDVMEQAAAETGVTMAQIALAWVLGKGNHIHAIPGTTDL
ncbi:MAG: aldo/keto reductase, partial [Rhodospirillaceae bacterium]